MDGWLIGVIAYAVGMVVVWIAFSYGFSNGNTEGPIICFIACGTAAMVAIFWPISLLCFACVGCAESLSRMRDERQQRVREQQAVDEVKRRRERELQAVNAEHERNGKLRALQYREAQLKLHAEAMEMNKHLRETLDVLEHGKSHLEMQHETLKQMDAPSGGDAQVDVV
jgi:hypothetical protein